MQTRIRGERQDRLTDIPRDTVRLTETDKQRQRYRERKRKRKEIDGYLYTERQTDIPRETDREKERKTR